MGGASVRAKARPAKAAARPKPKAAATPKPAARPKASAAATPKAKAAVRPKAKVAARPKAKAATTPRAKVVAKVSAGAPPSIGLDRYLDDGGGLRQHELPTVDVPSGRLAVGDPFAARGHVLARAVRPGRYPVTVVTATADDAERALAAFVRLAAGAIARWEPAAAEGDGAAAYAVDAAAGAFADARAFAAMLDERAGFPTASFAALEAQLLGEHYVPAWGWGSYQPGGAGSCVAFLTGGADRCPCWWGLDADGAPTILLTELAPP